jgi:hypothetical protein
MEKDRQCIYSFGRKKCTLGYSAHGKQDQHVHLHQLILSQDRLAHCAYLYSNMTTYNCGKKTKEVIVKSLHQSFTKHQERECFQVLRK